MATASEAPGTRRTRESRRTRSSSSFRPPDIRSPTATSFRLRSPVRPRRMFRLPDERSHRAVSALGGLRPPGGSAGRGRGRRSGSRPRGRHGRPLRAQPDDRPAGRQSVEARDTSSPRRSPHDREPGKDARELPRGRRRLDFRPRGGDAAPPALPGHDPPRRGESGCGTQSRHTGLCSRRLLGRSRFRPGHVCQSRLGRPEISDFLGGQGRACPGACACPEWASRDRGRWRSRCIQRGRACRSRRGNSGGGNRDLWSRGSSGSHRETAGRGPGRSSSLKNRRNLPGIIAFCLLLAALVGCASTKKPDKITRELLTSPKEVLFEKGRGFLEKKKYEQGRKYLNFVFETYPNEKEGRQSLLLVADSYFRQGGATGYTEARFRYRDYLNRYPGASQRDYARYQFAVCYDKEHEKPDRDQTSTREAISQYDALLREFPNSIYNPQARERIRRLTDVLAEHEFRVGFFYMRKGAPGAALARFTEYAERDKLFYYAAQVLKRLGRAKEAERYLARLIAEFPGSEYTRKAR